MPDWMLTLAIIGGFFIVFPLLWTFVVFILSRASGWHRLSQRYSSGARLVSGARHAGVTGMVGGVSYRGILTLHFDTDGFFMEPMVLFKIGQPRLFIPWADISERSTRSILWWRAAKLAIGQPVVATVSIPADLVEKYAPPA